MAVAERPRAQLRPTDLRRRNWLGVLVRAAKDSLDDGVTDLAAALAYYAFLAIPSALLLALGVFSLVASPDAIVELMDRFGGVVPAEAVTLLEDSLLRLERNGGGSLAMTIVGGALALWTTTGAMTALMRALNRAHERKETRSFVRQRLVALAMTACLVVAFALAFGLLVLGPAVTEWLEGVAGSWVGWVWWIAEWPVLLLGLFAAFATLLYLGPDVDDARWRFFSPGAALAVAIWLAASGVFAVYVSLFGSYNKAWGSLAAVIVMLTWLWLSALALLLGAEVNAEAERSRTLRRSGEPPAR